MENRTKQMRMPTRVNSAPLFVAVVKRGVFLSSPIWRASFVVLVAWSGGRRKVLEAAGTLHPHQPSRSNFEVWAA